MIAILGLVLAVGLFIVLSGDDSDDAPSTTTTSTQAQEPADGGQPTDEPKEPKPNPEPKPEVPVIEVKDGKPVGGVLELSVDKGEDIRFIVASDAAYEVHMHGYDVAQEVEAGGEVKFDVPATIDGVFEVELEEIVEPIAEISVNP